MTRPLPSPLLARSTLSFPLPPHNLSTAAKHTLRFRSGKGAGLVFSKRTWETRKPPEHNEREGRFCCTKGERKSHTERYMQIKKGKRGKKPAGCATESNAIEADP
jgi:hypothetical protein